MPLPSPAEVEVIFTQELFVNALHGHSLDEFVIENDPVVSLPGIVIELLLSVTEQGFGPGGRGSKAHFGFAFNDAAGKIFC